MIKGIIHFIHRYPDQASTLAKSALAKGKDVDPSIQQALARYDATFTVTLKPHCLSMASIKSEIADKALPICVCQGLWGAAQIPSIDQKIMTNGAAEFSPEYWAQWQIEGKKLGKNVAGGIAQGVAVGVCQSVATKLVNEHINDKKVSSLLVKAATPLVYNLYNKKFTLRNNTQAVLAVGIGQAIQPVVEKVASYLPDPSYKKNSYNNLYYYGVNGLYYFNELLCTKPIAIAVASHILAGKLCDNMFESNKKNSISLPVIAYGQM